MFSRKFYTAKLAIGMAERTETVEVRELALTLQYVTITVSVST